VSFLQNITGVHTSPVEIKCYRCRQKCMLWKWLSFWQNIKLTRLFCFICIVPLSTDEALNYHCVWQKGCFCKRCTKNAFDIDTHFTFIFLWMLLSLIGYVTHCWAHSLYFNVMRTYFVEGHIFKDAPYMQRSCTVCINQWFLHLNCKQKGHLKWIGMQYRVW
jgi:hypothetical protein